MSTVLCYIVHILEVNVKLAITWLAKAVTNILSCRFGHMKIVEDLIKVHQCEPSAVDHNGWTPLHHACW